MKKILPALFMLVSLQGFSQAKTPTDKDYAKFPYWIQMMDVDGVNYNEIVKAYDIYWQHHSMPEEEGDRYIGKGNHEKEKLSKKELRELRASNQMRFRIKQFEHWKIKNEPFVKEDGFVMTAAEKLKFHQENP